MVNRLNETEVESRGFVSVADSLLQRENPTSIFVFLPMLHKECVFLTQIAILECNEVMILVMKLCMLLTLRVFQVLALSEY